MKIAQIVCVFPPYQSGMGNSVMSLASGLIDRGHDVSVFTPTILQEEDLSFTEKISGKEPSNPQLREKTDFARRLSPPLKYGNSAWLPQLKKELDGFDLVHLHYPFFGTANLLRKWKKKNPTTPFVITYHMDNLAYGWQGLFFRYYARFWMPRILGMADLLIGSTLDYIKASDAARIYKMAPEKWMEIPFGVDTEKFKPRQKPAFLARRHGLDSNLPTVIFVGGMDNPHYFKGFSVLLRALCVLKKRGFDFQAVFVGEGEKRQEFEMMSVGMGLKNKVFFVGRASDRDLPYYYNLADLLVLPSINRCEAFGIVLLEAMASGVPVIASDLPGVRKVAADGGVIFPVGDYGALADEMLEFFHSRDQFAFGVRAREEVLEKYDWKKVVITTENAYLELLKK